MAELGDKVGEKMAEKPKEKVEKIAEKPKEKVEADKVDWKAKFKSAFKFSSSSKTAKKAETAVAGGAMGDALAAAVENPLVAHDGDESQTVPSNSEEGEQSSQGDAQ